MTEWLPLLISLAAILGSIYATFAGRSKIRAEASDYESSAIERYNRVILRQLTYLDDQMIIMRKETEQLQDQVAEYRAQMEKAVNLEANLRMEVGKLRNRVKTLEKFIDNKGLVAPPDENGF